MERNIIDAICAVVSSPSFKIQAYYKANNRANAMGDALENYVKDIFAGTIECQDNLTRTKIWSQVFSYAGNQNNPPDIMLRGGDAIEVKKIESSTSHLALNSSYPKDKLYSSSPMITKACKSCEKWNEKDMIYTIGVVNRKAHSLKTLAMVYGVDYCADKSVYEKIQTIIKKGIKSIPDVEFGKTRELGRVNRVDPLGITSLRVRGMWQIDNPLKVFSSHFTRGEDDFALMVIINNEKFAQFENTDKLFELAEKNDNLTIQDIEIKDPNNTVKLKSAKLITYRYNENN